MPRVPAQINVKSALLMTQLCAKHLEKSGKLRSYYYLRHTQFSHPDGTFKLTSVTNL